MAFNTFLYTPELQINIHPYTTAAPAIPSDFNSRSTSRGHLLPHLVCFSPPWLDTPLNHLFDNFFFTEMTYHVLSYLKNCTSVNFLVEFSPLFAHSFAVATLFWCASEKRERSQRGGSKSAKPEAGRALMECLRAGEGKAVIRI